MRTRCHLAPACLLVLLGLPLAAHAAPGDRKTLVVRGRVTDADGTPVVGARISAQGTHRARVAVDDAGQYELTLALGSPTGLTRRPVTVRVRAEQRGWRLELPGGEVELGVELRVVPGDDGVARCEVRSNQPRVTSAIARALTSDGEATGVAIVNFIGSRGAAIGSPPSLTLPVVDRVLVAGVRAPTAGPPPTALHAEATREQTQGAGAQAGEMAEVKPPKKKSKREPERSDPPAGIAPSMPSPAVVAAPNEAERELAEAKRRAERERSLAREAAKLSRDEAQKRDRLQRRTLAEEKARTAEEQRARGSAEDELLRGRDAQEQRWGALRHEVQMIAGSTDTTSAPPIGALGGLAGAPTRPEHRVREIAAPRLAATRDTVTARPPQPLPEPPVAPVPPASPTPRATARETVRPTKPPPNPPAASTPRWAPARDTVAAPPPRPSPRVAAAPAPTSAHSSVFPRPEGESRARARPLVIRAPGAAATPGTQTAAGDSCSCRIEGTVEVDSERPLPDRTRVAVSLGWYPAITDTVELFMGSPRSFTLPAAPCGPQRLRLVSLGATRYDVVSREAMAGFRCERGARHQFRIVLQPR